MEGSVLMPSPTATAPTTTVEGSAGASGGAGAAGALFGVAILASTIGGAYSAYASGRENRRIARFNAAMQQIRARDAIFRGQIAEQSLRTKTRRLIGAQRAAYAGQGVDVESGSALEVQADTAYQGELDAITIRNNAFREAFGLEIDAAQTMQAGQWAYRAGINNAAGTILGGASSAAGTYYMANRG